MEPDLAIIVNIHEAKINLSELLAAVAAGEEVVIANRNVPVARLVSYEQAGKRVLGFVGGEESWDDSFFDMLLEEELAKWGF